MRILEQSPERLAGDLLAHGARRAYVAKGPEGCQYHVSHPWLEPLAEALEHGALECVRHEGVFLEAHPETGALFGAFLHRTTRGQAQGGLRHWPYPQLEGFLRDGFRLSRGMTRKNASAGLWWGGGKGIIACPARRDTGDSEYRARVYRAYGHFVSSLRGCYVTAEDAGTTPPDMAEVFRATRFATCVPTEVGGSGNPSRMTAAGVVCAMEAALAFRDGGDLSGRRVVLQGTGNVGSALLALLFERGVNAVVASEISPQRREALLDTWSDAPLDVRIARCGDDAILGEPCDILAPCALGGVLNPTTIPLLRAKVVCGSANNQLADESRDGAALAARGITYIPDFVANRMGIVHCGNEQYGSLNDDPMVMRHLDPTWDGGIYASCLRILEDARATGISPVEAANTHADQLARQPHPIFGHRTRHIIEALLADHWQDS